MNAAAWRLTLASAALMGLVLGGRSAIGLFVSPLNIASGIGLSALSLALALGQLGIGLAQPVVGALADRWGAARVIVAGALVLAFTTALPAVWPAPTVLSLALVASAVAGGAVGSNGLLLGEVARAVSVARAGMAVGLVGAGGSAGSLVLGPATQWIIDQMGWSIALLAMAALSTVALPIALLFRRKATALAAQPSHPAQVVRSCPPLAFVLREWRFIRVAASFGVCGFHVGFLVGFLSVHMPGVIERCGLPASLAGTWIALAGAANIAGSIAIGFALKHRDAGSLLCGLHAARALSVALLLALPATPWVLLGFAVVGFAGIWLGGWAAEATGSDRLMWCGDAALALCAAALVWSLRAANGGRIVPALPQPSSMSLPTLSRARK